MGDCLPRGRRLGAVHNNKPSQEASSIKALPPSPFFPLPFNNHEQPTLPHSLPTANSGAMRDAQDKQVAKDETITLDDGRVILVQQIIDFMKPEAQAALNDSPERAAIIRRMLAEKKIRIPYGFLITGVPYESQDDDNSAGPSAQPSAQPVAQSAAQVAQPATQLVVLPPPQPPVEPLPQTPTPTSPPRLLNATMPPARPPARPFATATNALLSALETTLDLLATAATALLWAITTPLGSIATGILFASILLTANLSSLTDFLRPPTLTWETIVAQPLYEQGTGIEPILQHGRESASRRFAFNPEQPFRMEKLGRSAQFLITGISDIQITGMALYGITPADAASKANMHDLRESRGQMMRAQRELQRLESAVSGALYGASLGFNVSLQQITHFQHRPLDTFHVEPPWQYRLAMSLGLADPPPPPAELQKRLIWAQVCFYRRTLSTSLDDLQAKSTKTADDFEGPSQLFSDSVAFVRRGYQLRSSTAAAQRTQLTDALDRELAVWSTSWANHMTMSAWAVPRWLGSALGGVERPDARIDELRGYNWTLVEGDRAEGELRVVGAHLILINVEIGLLQKEMEDIAEGASRDHEHWRLPCSGVKGRELDVGRVAGTLRDPFEVLEQDGRAWKRFHRNLVHHDEAAFDKFIEDTREIRDGEERRKLIEERVLGLRG